MNSVSAKRLLLAPCALFLLLVSDALAKDAPTVIVWPDSGSPVVRFTFGKLRSLESVERQQTYEVDTQVENLWDKSIPEARFALYLFDEKNIRVGEGLIAISNVAPGEIIKFETTVMASGQAASMKLAAQSLPDELHSLLPPKTISLTVNSVPQEAHFTLDGQDAGTTPRAIEVAVGTHILEFDKEGFSRGKYLFSVGPDDVSGGSVSYELGASAHDTIEMRDGAILNGDLLSISATEVVVQVDGTTRTLDRAQVRRITLTERKVEHKPESKSP